MLIAHGVRSYSIFLDESTSDLFAYAEIESEAQWDAIASTEVCRRWWRHMRDIMPALRRQSRQDDENPIRSLG